MSGIFSEISMKQSLEPYIPKGESLLAGIHAVAKESKVTGIYKKCILTETSLIPHENGATVILRKEKYAAYDIYLGITQYSLLITGCMQCRYYYQFEDYATAKEADAQAVTSEMLLENIGKCFSFADIQSCEIKKGVLGTMKCLITMKNGDYFKLMLPKLGGLTGGMPHHAEYRNAILEQLGKYNK